MQKVLFAVDEVFPLYKIGGLGDVGNSLPLALHNLDVDVRIILPGHPEVDVSSFDEVTSFTISYNKNDLPIKIYKTKLQDSEVPVYVVSEADYISKPSDASDNDIDKFAVFSLASIIFMAEQKGISWEPDVIHLNDWHTGLMPLIGKTYYPDKNYTYILTIHNLAYQGETVSPVLEKLSISEAQKGSLNCMKVGIEQSDVIVPVSPQYAEEILTQEYGESLEKTLQENKSKITGIVNGLNLDIFSPAKDPHLFKNYDFINAVESKKINKTKLQADLDLQVSQSIPMIGYVGRVDPRQKGVQLIIEALKKKILPFKNTQFVFLGTGDQILERQLIAAASDHPDISISITYNEALASQIYAASDLVLIPSKFEPCGLVQLIAMRYGALPVARATGGLVDTIDSGKNGFLFDEYSVDAMITSLQEAFSVIENDVDKIRMIRSAMNRDSSWDASAREYIQVYNNLDRKKDEL